MLVLPLLPLLLLLVLLLLLLLTLLWLFLSLLLGRWRLRHWQSLRASPVYRKGAVPMRTVVAGAL